MNSSVNSNTPVNNNNAMEDHEMTEVNSQLASTSLDSNPVSLEATTPAAQPEMKATDYEAEIGKIDRAIFALSAQMTHLCMDFASDRSNEISLLTVRMDQLKLVRANLAETYKSFLDLSAKAKSAHAGSDDTSNSPARNTRIVSGDLPAFSVDPYVIAEKHNFTGENPFNLFIRKFERVFKDKGVDIEKEWLTHLETCFETTRFAKWFQHNLKSPVVESKRKLTWSAACDILRERFDLASRTNVDQWNQRLLKFKQQSNETLSDCLYRYREHLAGSKTNTTQSPFLGHHFISCLYNQEFREKVIQSLKTYANMNRINQQVKQSGQTTDDSRYSPRNYFPYVPENFDDFETVINNDLANLESSLTTIFAAADKSNKRTLADTQTNRQAENNKKRKQNPTPSSSGSSAKKDDKPNKNQISYMKRKGICIYCKTADYSQDHIVKCEARKKIRGEIPSENVSLNPNAVKKNILISSIERTDSNLNSNAVVNSSATVVNSVSSASNLKNNPYSDASILHDLETSSEDEFELQMKQIDLDNLNKNNEEIKHIFVVQKRNNTVGDFDGDVDSDNVAYSPVTPITLNDIKCYGMIDTGANASVISKSFADKHNIKYRSVPGSLVLANGTKIARLQTVVPLNVEYDGVDRIIEHTFDVLDENVISHKDKILIGVDLLPKLSIHLNNVAVKFKGSTKEDDSIDDKRYEPNVSPAGSEKEQEAFKRALKPYIDANMNIDSKSLCNLPEAVLHLPTSNNTVVNIRQYPIPYMLQPKVMEVINEWLKDGIIMPATPSGWNLPITVALKKNLDGTKTDKIRVVLDPRMLNKHLPVDATPLPLISNIFDAMAGSVVFTTLDLKSAFNQFPVNPDDRVKTTFTAPNNLQYMYRGSPFGISTISQLFSRVMLTLFKDLPYVQCFVDDLCIHSSSMQAHFHHVKTVIQILTRANLRLNFSKCFMAKSAVYLLGYSISAEGKRIDNRKLTNIMEWPKPTTSKQIMSFLGVANFFRLHIPNAALLMGPLDYLRSHNEKKEGPFIWTSTHQMHFDSIKNILASEIILSHPDLSHPFCISTDASDYSIGCCLYQEYKITKDDGTTKKIIKYIGFMARSLTRSEKLYSVTMRELLGVVYALKQYHKFIWGSHFTLYTDHRALCYLHSQKTANNMMIKWLDVILDYNFTVVHVKGLDNIISDKLSRLFPPRDDNEHDKDIKKRDQLALRRSNFATSNTMNQKKVAKLKQSYSDRNMEENTSRSILYVQSGQTLCPDYLIPPELERADLLVDAHHKVGHYGAEQMVKRLHSEGIHWPNLISDAVQFIRKCHECQRHNIQKKGYHPLRPIYSYCPGDHYAIDLGGPITTVKGSNVNYFMVIVDVCTRFCIIKGLPDKQSATIVSALIDVFSILGFPTKLQSDNGREFSNSLMKELADAMDIDHRFITPLHPSANGLSERYVQSVKKLLAKATNGTGVNWHMYLPAVQLALNNQISKRLNSTPFSLMFARRMNDPHGFRSSNDESKNNDKKPPMSHEELLKRIDYLADVVFPAIEAKSREQLEIEKAKFDNTHRLAEYAPGSHVMVRIKEKAGQLDAVYEGPYTVVRKNQGNAYVLRDETGVIMPRNYTTAELKLISRDEVVELDDEGNEITNYEVEAILNHRGPPNNYEYLVRWKNYSSEWDEWLPVKNFNDSKIIRDYWKRLGVDYKPKKRSVTTNSPTSAEALKSTPAGTVSKLINSMSDISLATDVEASDSSVVNPNIQNKNRKSKSKSKQPLKRNKVTSSVTPTRSSKRLKKSH